jgi:hypothetical protein
MSIFFNGLRHRQTRREVWRPQRGIFNLDARRVGGPLRRAA